MQTKQKVEQVKAYFSAVENPHNPFHEAVKDTEGCGLGRCKSWMGHTEDSMLQVCLLTGLKQTMEWEMYPNWFQHLYDYETQKISSKQRVIAILNLYVTLSLNTTIQSLYNTSACGDEPWN